ncbi:MAG: hypothetical protein RIR11_1287 [Bacteroidota bacterium]
MYAAVVARRGQTGVVGQGRRAVGHQRQRLRCRTGDAWRGIVHFRHREGTGVGQSVHVRYRQSDRRGARTGDRGARRWGLRYALYAAVVARCGQAGVVGQGCRAVGTQCQRLRGRTGNAWRGIVHFRHRETAGVGQPVEVGYRQSYRQVAHNGDHGACRWGLRHALYAAVVARRGQTGVVGQGCRAVSAQRQRLGGRASDAWRRVIGCKSRHDGRSGGAAIGGSIRNHIGACRTCRDGRAVPGRIAIECPSVIARFGYVQRRAWVVAVQGQSVAALDDGC